MFSSQTESIIDGSKVTSNFGVTKEEFLIEILPQGKIYLLLFIGYIYQTLRDYLGAHTYLYETDGNFNCFKVIIGQLSIKNSTFMNQEYIIAATGSKISIEGSSLDSINVSSKLLKISESDLILNNMAATNLT